MKIALVVMVAVVLTGSVSHGADSSGLYKARCAPHINSGKTDGYKCTNIGNGSNYQKAGLKDGDVVLSIDQVKIDGPKAAMDMLEEIDKGTCKEIVISRAGQEITLSPVFQ